MRKQKHSRQGGFIKPLTKEARKYILVYVDVAEGEIKTLGIYSSLTIAKQELQQQQTKTGVFHILSDTNRVLYSTKGGKIDAE